MNIDLFSSATLAVLSTDASNLCFISCYVTQHCGILRKAAEAGGLIVDAMAGIQDDAKDEPASVPLMVVENGCGSPCIDFRQVSSELAAAAKDADLVRKAICSCLNLTHFFDLSVLILNVYAVNLGGHGASAAYQPQRPFQV
jgi:hypothetical protein